MVRPEADASVLKILTDTSQPMTASMFRDLSQGLPVEADHIVGDMVRRAATLGVDATCAWPTRICRSIRRSARRADGRGGALFKRRRPAHTVAMRRARFAARPAHSPALVRGLQRTRPFRWVFPIDSTE